MDHLLETAGSKAMGASPSWPWPAIWYGERGGWYRLLVTLALCACGENVGSALVILISRLQGQIETVSSPLSGVVQVLAGALPRGLGLVGLLLGIRLVHRKSISCVFTDGRPFQWHLMAESVAVWAVLWLAGTLLLSGGLSSMVKTAGEISLAWWPPVSLATIIATGIQASSEEVLMRGYLQTRIAAWVRRPWLAVCISTLFFTGLHRDTNLVDKISLVAFGLATGVGAIFAGTVAPLIGMHLSANALMRLWHPSGGNAGLTWSGLSLELGQLAIWLLWLRWRMRRAV